MHAQPLAAAGSSRSGTEIGPSIVELEIALERLRVSLVAHDPADAEARGIYVCAEDVARRLATLSMVLGTLHPADFDDESNGLRTQLLHAHEVIAACHVTLTRCSGSNLKAIQLLFGERARDELSAAAAPMARRASVRSRSLF